MINKALENKLTISIYLERSTLITKNLGNYNTEQDAIYALNALMDEDSWKEGDENVVIARDAKVIHAFPLRPAKGIPPGNVHRSAS